MKYEMHNTSIISEEDLIGKIHGGVDIPTIEPYLLLLDLVCLLLYVQCEFCPQFETTLYVFLFLSDYIIDEI